MVEHAVDAGWTVSAQVVAAYLTLAWVALDRDEHAEADGWLGRVAEVEAVIPEPHIQLAAAALTALRRADARRPGGRAVRTAADDGAAGRQRAPGARRPAAAGGGRSAVPDRVTSQRAGDVLARVARPGHSELRRGPWPACTCPPGDLAAAEEALRPVPGRRRDGARAGRGRHPAQPDRRAAGPRGRAVAAGGRAARSGSARDAAALPGRGGASCATCSAPGSKPGPRSPPSPWT